MPRSAAPLWHARSGDDLDPYIHASINQASGICDETGKYATCVASGLNDFCGHTGEGEAKGKSACWSEKKNSHKCEVHEVIRQLYNATSRVGGYKKTLSLPWPKIVNSGSCWQIHYHVIGKSHAKKHVLDTYGPDRSQWPYDPRHKETKKK